MAKRKPIDVFMAVICECEDCGTNMISRDDVHSGDKLTCPVCGKKYAVVDITGACRGSQNPQELDVEKFETF